ncbi:MAG: sulfotransferase domain-containing protein [Cyanobacteria bacterium P01_H01_bin.15]
MKNFLLTRYHLLQDVKRTLTKSRLEDRGCHHVFVSSIPKSGSTYLSTLIEELPGMAQARLLPNTGRREQELDALQLCKWHRTNYVARHHTKFNETTLRYIRDYQLTPIVLIRDLFDVVFSVKDHHHRENVLQPYAHVPDSIVTLSDAQQLEFIVAMIMPWYISFFASWVSYDGPCLWLNYSDLVKESKAVLTNVVQFAQLPATTADIEHAITNAQKRNTRQNVGVVGRGASLPESLKERIRNLTTFYPHIDFSPLGL